MDHQSFVCARLAQLKHGGNCRIFIDLQHYCGAFPSAAQTNGPTGREVTTCCSTGDPVTCKSVSDVLPDAFSTYIRPINRPTAPRGTERQRIKPSPVHGPGDVRDLVDVLGTLRAGCRLARQPLVAQ